MRNNMLSLYIHNNNQTRMRKQTALFILLACCMTAHARLVITKTTCNYQSGHTAIAEEGRIRVGWQYTDTEGLPLVQNVYQIEVHERVTGQLIYDSGTVRSGESQQIELPHLAPNIYGYSWHVRIGYESRDDKQWNHWTAWSATQDIRVTPDNIRLSGLSSAPGQNSGTTPLWIGAITKQAARIPDGRWSNEVFRKDTFKTRWENVDTLSARSIILRKQFTASREITDAVVYVCGLGHYEMSINGRRVGNSEFAPLWSEYSRTVYYNTYDVTQMLQQGGNAVTVLLGNGFFNVQRGNRYSKLQASFGPPQLLLRMDITYADGETEHILSDESWHWTASPITFNSIYGGESYDARLEQDGCQLAVYDDSKWSHAVAMEGPAGRLRPETAPPVKIMERYDVRKISHIDKDSLDAASRKTKRTVSPTAFVCDMGQNLAGYPQITVSGQRGQKVTLIVSERLTPQGTCDQSQTGRQHYYEYTLRGDGMETWHPRFSYYGFRYIQVEGAVMQGKSNPDSLPVIHQLQSCFVHSSAPETSTFWCDNELMTKTHRLIERAERSNMQAVMTDCPQREKLGWLEQDHLCGPSLLYNYDMTTLVPKIIRDIADTQKPNGMVPTTAPQYVSFGNLFDDSPEWGSTLIILPFMYYDMYGDSTLITDYYEPMRRYVDYLTSRADDGIVSHGLGDWYDYGPRRPGFSQNTPVPLVATAHYIYDLQLITEAARMTGRRDDMQKYQALYDQTVDAFNRHFYHPDSCYYGTGSQTSNALPLFLGIAGENKEAVLRSLIDDIHAHGDRLTTGDVGNRYLFRVLADNGHNELLFRMLNHYETPGYGFQIAQGATTLTEQWDPRQGSSENHFMLGQIDEWFFRTLAGIRQKPGTHGMRHLIIDPQAVGDIHQVKASIHTLYGTVSIDFDRKDSTLNVVVPKGCEVELPEMKRKKIETAPHLLLFCTSLMCGAGKAQALYDYELYDPQLPTLWMGYDHLANGILGNSDKSFHLQSGFFKKMEVGCTFFQLSKNVYKGIAGFSTALQIAGEIYQLDNHWVAQREGKKIGFQYVEEAVKNNTFPIISIRIPLLAGLQTYSRKWSIQTGPVLHADWTGYHYRIPGHDQQEEPHLHVNHFRASWMLSAGIGPLTLSVSQDLVPAFQLTNGVKGYTTSFSIGFDMWYLDRRFFRPRRNQ